MTRLDYHGRFARTPMPYGALYLNNDGSRWVTQDMRFILVLPDGTRKVRLADWYESFGNFGSIAYRYRGKRFRALPKACDGSETSPEGVTGQDRLAHIFHRVD